MTTAEQLHGTPITKPSKRKTDRAPHMGQYVRIGKKYGKDGLHIVIGNQGFFMPLTIEKDISAIERKQHLQWMRDMFCVALEKLVALETAKR